MSAYVLYLIVNIACFSVGIALGIALESWRRSGR